MNKYTLKDSSKKIYIEGFYQKIYIEGIYQIYIYIYKIEE